MEIKFYCTYNGKKQYKVLLHGEEIFCGNRRECQRFIKIHNEKADSSRAAEEAPPRTEAEGPRQLSSRRKKSG